MVRDSYFDHLIMSQTKHRVLLTGASGFIGNHILAQLLSAGFSVRAIVRSQVRLFVAIFLSL
jgi:nucleoside-diphosphate-sugar epimerase